METTQLRAMQYQIMRSRSPGVGDIGSAGSHSADHAEEEAYSVVATVGTIKRALTEYYDTQIPNREVNRLLTLGLGHEPNEGEVHEDDTHVSLASFMNGVRTTIIPRYSLKEEVSERQQRDDFLREVSPAEKAAIAACFEEVDESGDGELDIDELEELLTKIYGMEPSKVQVQQLMLAIDLDGDGAVDLEEFISAMATVKEVQDASAIFQWRQLFERYDQDESGELGRAELMVMAEEMWGEGHTKGVAFAELLAQADVDGDGLVSWPEFLEMMKQIQSGSFKPGSSQANNDTQGQADLTRGWSFREG